MLHRSEIPGRRGDTRWALATLALAGLLAALPGGTGRPPLAGETEATPEEQAPFKFIPLIGKLHEEKLLWRANWMTDDGAGRPSPPSAFRSSTPTQRTLSSWSRA
jgi:hypothetical protein